MRERETKVELHATADEVRRAVSEGPEIMKWFEPVATVTPGADETVMVSWGPGLEGDLKATRRGWPIFLAALKHGLERHKGEPVLQVGATGFSSLGTEAVWTALLEAVDGVQTNVWRQVGPGFVRAIVDDWNDAFLFALCEPVNDKFSVTVQVVLYGEEVARAAKHRDWVESTMAAAEAQPLG